MGYLDLYRFDKSRLDLAREFRTSPHGRHSPDLQYLLNFMRQPSGEPFHVLVTVKTGERWRLATIIRGRSPAVRLEEVEFTSLEDAEWHVFQLRWTQLAGEVPAVE